MASRTDDARRTRDLLRLKVSLVDSDPEIWRLLEVDAALTLEQVHDVLQIAMGWRNSHLHSFTDTDPYERLRAVDGRIREPRRWTSAFVLEEDPDGLPETEWTLGQVLSEESGPLFYEYDFGDGWTHRLAFIEHLEVPASEPPARLVRGERRAPLEDSGGPHGYQELLEALADPQHEDHQEATEWVAATAGPWRPFAPAHLDVDAVNRELALLLAAQGDDEGGRSQPGIPTLVAELVDRMPPALRPEFRSYVDTAQLQLPPEVEAEVAERMVAPFLWLIRRVGPDGLDLTAAGWLSPAVVRQAVAELGWEDRWIGKQNREDQTWPVRQLREQAQRLGLLRKLKGRLLLSVAARPLLDDPVGLWFFLARSLAHRHRHDAERDATLLLALEVATGRGATADDCLPAVGFGLEALGWSAGDGWGLPPEAVEHVLRDSEGVLVELGVLQDSPGRAKAASTPEVRAFARAVLRS